MATALVKQASEGTYPDGPDRRLRSPDMAAPDFADPSRDRDFGSKGQDRRHGFAGRFLRTSSFRLTLTYVGMFGISVLMLLVFIYFRTAQSISQQTDETIAAEIDALAQHYRTGGLPGLVAAIDDRDSSQTISGGLYLLTDANSRRVAGNVSRWPADVQQDTIAGRQIMFPLAGREDSAVFGRGQVFRLPGGFTLLVGRDTHELERFQVLMMDAIAWALGGTVLLGLGGGYFMTRRVLRRIDNLNRGATRIMHGDMSHRMGVDGSGDEFDRVARTLNAMLDQIERLMTGIKTVTNAVAHDLRSPLTRMRTQLEGAVISAHSAAEYREACEAVITEADGLLATFNALLSIAEAEAGVGAVELREIDVGGLLSDMADLYSPVAEEHGLRMEVSIEAGVTLRANRELLFQALANLVDNAIKYVPPPGTITLSVTETAASIDLAVIDNGPGIPVQDRGRVVERFVRLDASRTTPGNGLGLSLVAAIARKHRGTFDLEDAGPGLRAVLHFPKVTDKSRR